MTSRHGLDRLAAYGLVLLSVAVIFFAEVILQRRIYTVAGILLGLPGLIWLLRPSSFGHTGFLKKVPTLSKTGHKLLLIGIAIAFVVYILQWYGRPLNYSRPDSLFYLQIVIYLAILGQILFTEHDGPLVGDPSTYLLVAAAALGILPVVGMFHGAIGIDPWFHNGFFLDLMDTGHVPNRGLYARLPVFHVSLATFASITTGGYQLSSLAMGALPQSILFAAVVVAFAARLFDTRVALVSGWLVVTNNQFIFWGFRTTPFSTATALMFLTLYMLFRSRFLNTYRKYGVAILLVVAITLTHALVSFALFVLLWAGIVVHSIHRRVLKIDLPGGGRLPFVAFSSVIILGWWTLASGHLDYLVLATEQVLAGLGYGFGQAPRVGPAIAAYAQTIPPIENVIHLGGIMLFGAIGLIGVLMAIATPERHPSFASWSLLSPFPFALAFVALLVGQGIIQHRWYTIGVLLLAVPTGVAIVYAFSYRSNGRRPILQPLLMSIGLVMMITAMVLSPFANMDNDSFTPHLTVRFAYTDSEIIAAQNIAHHADGPIASDFTYGAGSGSSIFANIHDSEVLNIDRELYQRELESVHGTIVLRRALLDNPLKVAGGRISLDNNPFDFLASPGVIKFYDDGEVAAIAN